MTLDERITNPEKRKQCLDKTFADIEQRADDRMKEAEEAYKNEFLIYDNDMRCIIGTELECLEHVAKSGKKYTMLTHANAWKLARNISSAQTSRELAMLGLVVDVAFDEIENRKQCKLSGDTIMSKDEIDSFLAVMGGL